MKRRTPTAALASLRAATLAAAKAGATDSQLVEAFVVAMAECSGGLIRVRITYPRLAKGRGR